ncbi:Cullin binding-domain-containing protein, partial [Absidia repens]
YQAYKDVDDPNGNITPEGAQQFFEDIGVSLESVYPILIGWKMNASRMGYFTKQEWMDAMTNLRMDVDVALALWRLLLDENSNHISSFLEFIRVTKPVKVINKDQWSSLLDFIRTVPNDLEGYDSTSSWPVLFDDYVNWR